MTAKTEEIEGEARLTFTAGIREGRKTYKAKGYREAGESSC